jgi:transcriptional regulator with XRE-family HTH domain
MPEESDVSAGTDAKAVAEQAAADTAAFLALLRHERESRGWTLDDLAARIDGISAHMLAKLEGGTVALRYTEVLQICAALDRDPSALVAEALARQHGRTEEQ